MKKTMDEIETKKCSQCEKELPLEEFGKRKNENGTDTIYYRSMCPDCYTIRSKEWQKENKKQYNEYQRIYQQKRYTERKNDPEYKEKRNAYAREYYQKKRQQKNGNID